MIEGLLLNIRGNRPFVTNLETIGNCLAILKLMQVVLSSPQANLISSRS
jgi:hypothetical protein